MSSTRKISAPPPGPTPRPPLAPAPAARAEPRQGHGIADLFHALGDRLVHDAGKLLGRIEHAAWQVEEDLQAHPSGRPEAEQIFVHHGLWAQKVSGGQTAGVSLDAAQAALDGMLGEVPVPLAHNPELGRAASFDEVGDTLRLSADSRRAVGKLQAPFDAMFAQTVDALGAVRAGTLTPAGYQLKVMSNAATIASDWATARDLPESARNEAFARLVHFAFCAHRDDDSGEKLGSTDLKREAIGFGISDAGSLLEDTFRMTVAQRYARPGEDAAHPRVFGNGVPGGYSYRVQDRQSGGSTVTHHFGEFLGAGFVDLFGQADPAVTQVDSPKANPADVRNGHFAVMLGKGLAAGTLAPDQAVALTRWALTQPSPGEAPPPWGNPPEGVEDGQFLSPGDYQLSTWLDAYRAAH